MAVRLNIDAVQFVQITDPKLTLDEFKALRAKHSLVSAGDLFELRTGKKVIHMNGMHVMCDDEMDAVQFRLQWL